TSSAGVDQTICSTASATLAANNPAVGTGTWSVVSGPSTASTQFGNVNTFNTTFTPAGGAGSYTLRWTISNAPCASSTDNVVITLRATPTATISIASPNPSTICSGSTTVIHFTGPSNGVVTYNINGVSSLTISLNNGGIANLTTAALTANTTYTLESVAYGNVPGCSATASGSVTVTVNQPPSFTSCPSDISQ